MKLLPSEYKINTPTERWAITLTNYRLKIKEENGKFSNETSMFLEHISSIEKKHFRYKFLFWPIAIFLLSIPAIVLDYKFKLGRGELIFISIMAGISVLLIIFYYGTQKTFLSFISDSGSKIKMEIKGSSNESIEALIYEVSIAKMNRINELYKFEKIISN
jgi:hypothetical protein